LIIVIKGNLDKTVSSFRKKKLLIEKKQTKKQNKQIVWYHIF